MSDKRSQVLSVLETVEDPEIPAINIVEMGMIRDVRVTDEVVSVDFAPTYSGCPALEVIEREIVQALRNAGYQEVQIQRVLSPAWTTEWISDSGRKKLKEQGITPPCSVEADLVKFPVASKKEAIVCPRCEAQDTACVSAYGSTPCKSLYYCKACDQPFEYFKPH